MDSNHRYRKVTDLQSAAIATMRHSHFYFFYQKTLTHFKKKSEPPDGLEPPTY